MNPTLQRKLQKVLETKTSSPELLGSLKDLSTFYGENSLATRRQLRGNIEERCVEINNDFLLAFSAVHQKLQVIENVVQELNKTCDSMSARIETTRQTAGRIIKDVAALDKQRKNSQIKLQIAEQFISRFQLSEEETNALRAANITDKFFEALSRVHRIHNDCKLLLRTQHQRAGLDTMELMSMYEQSAYERLYRWTKVECRKLESSDCEISPLVKQALFALNQRPVLLGYCMEEIESARSRTVVRNFLAALTQGGPNGIPRPIELQAHDPERYVGDMLGWIHQAAASEFELCCTLFGTPDRTPTSSSDNWESAGRKEGGDFTNDNLQRVHNRSLEGVCRPFKIRFESVLKAQSDAAEVVVMYRLAKVLGFYKDTFDRQYRELPVCSCLAECHENTMKEFFNSLKNLMDAIQRSPPVPPLDLSPPQILNDSLTRLVELCSTFNEMLVPPEQQESQFAPVLQAIVEPLLVVCQLSATSLTRPTDMAIFLINCTSALQEPLRQYNFTAARVEMMDGQIEAHMDTLVIEETKQLLETLKLSNVVAAVQNLREIPLSKMPGMDANSVSQAIQTFESSLRAEEWVLPLHHCDQLKDTVLRNRARSGVCQMIYNSYSDLYKAVMDPANEYPQPEIIIRYAPDQMKTMITA